VEALRCLLRDRVLARVHDELGDEDAWAIALCEALLREPLEDEALDQLRARIEELPAAAWAGDLIDEARVRAPVAAEQREAFFGWLRGEPPPGGAEPGEEEGGTVEVTPEELADELSAKMYEVNADLALASEAWEHLPPEGRRAIVEQAKYVAALLPHLKLDDEG
jgi:hypothetical protein